MWELWGALLHGGGWSSCRITVSRAPEAFHELLRRERVTVLNQTPSAFRQLIAADARADAGSDLGLRLVIFGGEALELQPAALVRAPRRRQPRLVNMYGITETTVHVTYRPIRRDGPGRRPGQPDRRADPGPARLHPRSPRASRCRSACGRDLSSAAPAWRAAT